MRRKRKIVEKREGERQGGHEDSRRERVVEEKDGGTKCEKKGEERKWQGKTKKLFGY